VFAISFTIELVLKQEGNHRLPELLYFWYGAHEMHAPGMNSLDLSRIFEKGHNKNGFGGEIRLKSTGNNTN
jgi:hypothetical protein